MTVALWKNKLIKFRPAKCSFKSLAAYIFVTGLVVIAVYAGVAYTVTILVDSKPEATVHSYSRNLDELLLEVDLPLNPEDRVIPDPATPLSGQIEIEIEKAFPVYVLKGASTTKTWTTRKQIRKLLKEEGFALSPDDRGEPEGTVCSVANTKLLRVEKVNSAASYAPDQLTKIRQVNPTALHRGTNRFMQAELAGKDAEEVSSQSGPDATKNMSGATAVPPAVENGEVLDWAGTAIKFNQVIVVTATAYCPGTPESGCPLNSQGRSLCTDWYNDGYTYTGKKAVQGEGTLDSPRIVAVDPRIIPLSSKIYLEGIGFAVAEDIGGSIQGNRIDILFNLHQDALKFGLRKGIKLYVLAGTG